ncbi:hypothetical protein BLA29_004579 [Euroglyphus maynei]|uniref:Uncharacterized protein n=1 Tax=Euroglyphus maynei TaxID=6958 RepID=A0A1Y3AYT6_EURMA|nr:hypothetical protein BLA29_004579 [Euroglyphus maynei]
MLPLIFYFISSQQSNVNGGDCGGVGIKLLHISSKQNEFISVTSMSAGPPTLKSSLKNILSNVGDDDVGGFEEDDDEYQLLEL